MAKYALVVMSETGEANPAGQARMLHALKAAKELKAGGHDVRLWFHGVGVIWLSTFAARNDPFGRHYGSLFDELRDDIGGACEFCAVQRFGAADGAKRLGVEVVGGPEEHHTVAPLLAEGYQVVTF
ncbi:MAG TPA: DsrE family protein [Actinomycetes bacterium]|nr:DsrE family protein [Actinomycetes bacterium]